MDGVWTELRLKTAGNQELKLPPSSANRWQAAGYLGMSLEVLLNTYGHHHPDYLSDAVEKIAKREPIGERKAHVSGAAIPLRRNSS